MLKNGMRPVHPGEILGEDYLVPLGMSANALAKALNVRHRELMTLCASGVALRRILPCAWRDTSAATRVRG